jgi:hypothetical protein
VHKVFNTENTGEIFKKPKKDKKAKAMLPVGRPSKIERLIHFLSEVALLMVCVPLFSALVVLSFKVLKVAIQLEIKP